MPARATIPVGAHLRVSGATPRGDGLGTGVHEHVYATSRHAPPLLRPREHHRKRSSRQRNRSNCRSRERWIGGLRRSDPDWYRSILARPRLAFDGYRSRRPLPRSPPTYRFALACTPFEGPPRCAPLSTTVHLSHPSIQLQNPANGPPRRRTHQVRP